jgi:hypothetical protein
MMSGMMSGMMTVMMMMMMMMMVVVAAMMMTEGINVLEQHEAAVVRGVPVLVSFFTLLPSTCFALRSACSCSLPKP